MLKDTISPKNVGRKLYKLKTNVLETRRSLHIVAPNDVETKHNLFNALRRAEHSFMALIENQVDRLVEPLEGTLKKHEKMFWST